MSGNWGTHARACCFGNGVGRADVGEAAVALQMAALAGTSPETATKVLGEVARRGLILLVRTGPRWLVSNGRCGA
jgi:hypothetical protein